VAFRNGTTLVVANVGSSPVPLPAGCVPLLSSSELADSVPPDTTVWAAAS
jgi:alpha-glucosidase